jgi:hypothetical protein
MSPSLRREAEFQVLFPPTTNSATKCSEKCATHLSEKCTTSHPEGSSNRTIELYRIKVHQFGSELLGDGEHLGF